MGHICEIDERHLLWLKSVLMSGRFKRVLEIGSYRGYSTAAFLEALEAGAVQEVHLCEPYPKIELEWGIASCSKRSHVALHKTLSTDLLDRLADWDFIFVDGEHSKATVLAELERLVPMGVPCLMAHDTSSVGRYEGCDGPQYTKWVYQAEGYYCLEDALDRPDERTHRGMFFAASTPDLYKIGLDGYQRYCG